MIVSTYRKSYDTADGTEQLHDGRHTTSDERQHGRDARQHWADDGGPVNEPLPPSASIPAAKPAWSVRPLQALLAAIHVEKVNAPARREYEHVLAHAAAVRARANYDRQVLAAEREAYPWSLNVATGRIELRTRPLGATARL